MCKDYKASVRSFTTIGLAVLAFAVTCSDGFGYYQAEKGRWMSRDPIGEVGFMIVDPNDRMDAVLDIRDPIQASPYNFVHNTPVNGIDYSGLLWRMMDASWFIDADDTGTCCSGIRRYWKLTWQKYLFKIGNKYITIKPYEFKTTINRDRCVNATEHPGAPI
jgi:hypothetical protein